MVLARFACCAATPPRKYQDAVDDVSLVELLTLFEQRLVLAIDARGKPSRCGPYNSMDCGRHLWLWGALFGHWAPAPLGDGAFAVILRAQVQKSREMLKEQGIVSAPAFNEAMDEARAYAVPWLEEPDKFIPNLGILWPFFLVHKCEWSQMLADRQCAGFEFIAPDMVQRHKASTTLIMEALQNDDRHRARCHMVVLIRSVLAQLRSTDWFVEGSAGFVRWPCKAPCPPKLCRRIGNGRFREPQTQAIKPVAKNQVRRKARRKAKTTALYKDRISKRCACRVIYTSTRTCTHTHARFWRFVFYLTYFADHESSDSLPRSLPPYR